jgi:hypothetical protein
VDSIERFFVVYLIIYNGDKLPPYYIGSTNTKKIKEGYLGSICSKKWKEIYKSEILNNKHLFNIKILSNHDNRYDALCEEYRTQKELNVVNSEYYFNESFASVNGYFGRDVSGKNNPMYGRTGEVICKNINTGEKIRVKEGEFNENDHFVGHTKGNIFVIDNEKISITKISTEEFNTNRHKYTHLSEGFKHTDETKTKLSLIRKGMITAKHWDGSFERVHKNDIRFENDEIGNTTSKRWVITDLNGVVYKTFNYGLFFKKRGLRYPRKEHIDEDGVIYFKKISNKLKSTHGWIIKCLD